MEKKITYMEAVNFAIDRIEDGEVKDKLIALRGQLEKHGTGKKGMTKVQKDNLELKAMLWNLVEDEPDGMTATEIGRAVGLTTQKVAPQLSKLVGEGHLEKRKVGKEVRYFFVDASEDVEVE